MHILLIHQAFVTLDEPGGTSHHELARGLAARGHRVTVIASTVSYLTGKSDTANDVNETIDGGSVTVLRARTYSALHRSFVHRVFSFFSFMASSFLLGLKVRQVDLVWGTSPPIFQGVTAWCLARLKRAPFLFEVRDLWPAFAIQVGVLRNPVLIRLSVWLERFLYHRANRVMVNSPGFVEHVQRGGARRVELVPNGVDTQMFDPMRMGSLSARTMAWRTLCGLAYGAHGLSTI
jgi:glycosyltransferase involved in cell wall biosynthesis